MQHSAMAKDIDKLGINPYGLQQPSRQRQERAEERRPVPKVPPGFEPSGSGKHRAAAAAPPPPPPPPRATHGSSQRHSSSSHAAASSSRAGPKADLRRVPIVLVPAASSAKINMFNARSFLEEGAFKTAEQCKAGTHRRGLPSFAAGAFRDLALPPCWPALPTPGSLFQLAAAVPLAAFHPLCSPSLPSSRLGKPSAPPAAPDAPPTSTLSFFPRTPQATLPSPFL
uniref:Uncharacterized protein n=1 Tax=Tetraselmis sp. GSL018 TaxID=582737 RepID=A0A061RU74_9CHLO